jgi:hypothetical protein
MIFAILTLLTALGLAAVAGWFSIIGMMAIYAGAPMYALMLGVTLETGKLVTISWLYRNWEYIGWKLKAPLIYFIIAIMAATSIGVYGFLTKSHLDQGASTLDSSARVVRLEEQIAKEKTLIADNDKVTEQLDSTVKVLTDAQRIRGRDGSIAVRKSQEEQRNQLRESTASSQKTIDGLSEERFKLESEVRKLELDVGPIRYIAELIYSADGDAKQNIEAAVRMFTSLIVSTLDPLAILLLIAANHTFIRLQNEKKKMGGSERPGSGPGLPDPQPQPSGDPVGYEAPEGTATSPPKTISVGPVGSSEGPSAVEIKNAEIYVQVPRPSLEILDEEIKGNAGTPPNLPNKSLRVISENVVVDKPSDPPPIVSNAQNSRTTPIPSTSIHTVQSINETEKTKLEGLYTDKAGLPLPVIRPPTLSLVTFGKAAPEGLDTKKDNEPKGKTPWGHQSDILWELIGAQPHFIPQKVNEEMQDITKASRSGDIDNSGQATKGSSQFIKTITPTKKYTDSPDENK